MGEFVARVRTLALAWGATGLFAVTLLDSSILPLPGVADVLLIVSVTRHRHLVLLYAGAATLGSLCGCLVLHYAGRKGGEAVVRRRFARAEIDRALASLRRHGVMAVLIPSLLPPPAPFKIFVLLAGAVGIGTRRFAVAIVIGRGTRYLALGLLAVEYGSRAERFLRDHGALASLAAVGILAAGLVVYLWHSHARAAKNR
jgi:membrane protein YqaA with SNARE-associated domain